MRLLNAGPDRETGLFWLSSGIYIELSPQEDTDGGVKQSDKMALTRLEPLLSLIEAHTHAAQRETVQTQFSATAPQPLFSSAPGPGIPNAENQPTRRI